MPNLSDLFPGGRCPTAREPESWNQNRRGRAAPPPAQPQFYPQPAPMMMHFQEQPYPMQPFFPQQFYAQTQPCPQVPQFSHQFYAQTQPCPQVPQFSQQFYAQTQPCPQVPQFMQRQPYQHVQQPYPQVQRPNHRRFPRAAPLLPPSRPQAVPAWSGVAPPLAPSSPPPAPSSPPAAPSTPPPPPSQKPSSQVSPRMRSPMPPELASSAGLESELSVEDQQVWDKALSQIRKFQIAGYAPNAEMWAEKEYHEFGNLRYYLNFDSRRVVLERPVVTDDGSVVVLDEAECQRLRELEATISRTTSSG